MKNVFGYIRVSTVKQGQGVSLQEQKEAILRYAEKHELQLIHWFEEKETAAKQGRPLFTKMIKLLRSGKSRGVIIHKIDRSARNLKDWAILGDLIDEGIDVHFAHESLDLETRGGRLAADIQAVIASDYIRNLREEALKGLYGRLKQGIYPFGAPIGYNNMGGGKIKEINAIQGPLVKQAFNLYATGNFNLKLLTKHMNELGLRNTKGSGVSIAAMSYMLNNPFYAGVLKVKGKTFSGQHQPIVSVEIFQKVQDVLHGKTNLKVMNHQFLFRKMINCGDCKKMMVGEKQKGHVYYRCHTKDCQTKTIREEKVESAFLNPLNNLRLSDIEERTILDCLNEAALNWNNYQDGIQESLKLQEMKILNSMERLTDAYIENAIEKNQFERKKEKFQIELSSIRQKINSIPNQKTAILKKAHYFLELLKDLQNSFINGIEVEKRRLVKTITSNLALSGKEVMFSMLSPFAELANRKLYSSSPLDRNEPRTCKAKSDREATNGDNQEVYVADLEINPETGQAEPINVRPIVPQTEDVAKVKERMQELLGIILGFFEVEAEKVEQGVITEEETLLSPYVQENHPDTQPNTRPIPQNFICRRA